MDTSQEAQIVKATDIALMHISEKDYQGNEPPPIMFAIEAHLLAAGALLNTSPVKILRAFLDQADEDSEREIMKAVTEIRGRVDGA